MQFEGFTKAHERLTDLLGASAVNTAIPRLTQHSGLQTWVASGIELHQELSSEACEFCGGALHLSRLQELQAHFNEEYKKLGTPQLSRLLVAGQVCRRFRIAVGIRLL